MTDFESEKTLAVTDPVCGKELSLDQVMGQEEYDGWAYFFCSQTCRSKFLREPSKYASRHRPIQR